MNDSTMSELQLAQMLGKSEDTVRRWRYDGKGPKYHRTRGRSVLYFAQDVVEWMATRDVTPKERDAIMDGLALRVCRLGVSSSQLSRDLGFARGKVYAQTQLPMTPKRLEWLGVVANIEPATLRKGLREVDGFPLPPEGLEWRQQTREALEVLGSPGSPQPGIDSPEWSGVRQGLWWSQ